MEVQMFYRTVMTLLLSVIYTQSVEAKELTNLSLDKALTIMRENNLELKISKFNEQMKIQEAKIANGYNYGKLNLQLQALRSNDAGNVFGFKLKSREATFGDFGFAEFDMSGQSNPLPVQPRDLNYPDARNHFQTTLTYQVPLYTGGKLSQYSKITKALTYMSQLDTERLLNEKIFQTKKTFYDISLIEQYIEKLSSIVNNIDKLEEIVANMRQEGYAKEIDQLEVQARKAEAQSMLSQATYNRELAYQYLSFLINETVSSIQPLNKLAPLPTFTQEEIVQNNLDIQKAQLGLKVTDMAVKVEESKLLPTIGAFGEYGSADNSAFNNFRAKDFYTVGVQLEWNIFNGDIDRQSIEKAKIKNMQVQEQVALAKAGITLQIKKLMTNIKSKNAEIESLETQYQFAEKVYENYEGRYQEGIASITDVLIKQSKELEVLLKLLTAKNDRNAKVFELTSVLNKGENS